MFGVSKLMMPQRFKGVVETKAPIKQDAIVTLLTVAIYLTLVKEESECVLLDVFGGFQNVKLLTGWNHRYHVPVDI